MAPLIFSYTVRRRRITEFFRKNMKSVPRLRLENDTRTSKYGTSILFQSTRKTQGGPFGIFNVHSAAKSK